MSHPERPLSFGELPPELADFLRSQDYACVTQETDLGTVLVIKIPSPEIQSVPLEMFVNVADAQQRADFAALSSQEQFPMLFYDEALALQLTKVMPYMQQEQAAAILTAADEILGSMTGESFDFDAAKTAVMEATRL